MKRGVAVLLALLAALPLSVLSALATWRGWGWFETRTGIEALGHSGPAGWCFMAMLLACLLAGGTLAWRWTKGKEHGARHRE